MPGDLPTRNSPGSLVWAELDEAALLEALGTGPEGLTEQDAGHRLHVHGPNELPPVHPDPWWKVLGRQLAGPLIFILLIAGAVTIVQREWVDATAIFVVIVLNATLGFWQTRKAERDLRGLRSLSTTVAQVVRGDTTRTVPSREVVPGDIVLLVAGERVPADLRLLRANALRVDESLLTGESFPVDKQAGIVAADAVLGERTNMVYSGTLVTAGRGRAVAVATGADTELGAISDLVQAPPALTPLQQKTRRLERQIVVALLAAIFFVFVAGVVGGYAPGEMVRTAVALAVASVPESLPIVLTVALSVGVSQMARRRAIVRHLPAVETLGSTTVILSDKTGTLTQNRLTVTEIWTVDGAWRPGEHVTPTVRRTLRAGALTNEAAVREGVLVGDSVDVAMASAALDAGAVTADERAARAEAYTPYEPELRLSQSVRHDPDGRRMLFVKGAPDVILTLCTTAATLDGDVVGIEMAEHAHRDLADRGLRVIATAERELDDGELSSMPLPSPARLTFLGFEAMIDPPRPGVEEAIASCARAGMTVKMLTGDHPATAQAIAGQLGVPHAGHPLTGGEMAALDEAALVARLAQTNVVARATPQDKLRIVRALTASGETVAVTGDGVNDAPALKAAAIGVAMGRSGTDVARDAADLILTDDDFVTIVHAVEQGRVTFAAIRNATFFLLSTGIAAVLALTVNLLLDQPLLFLPVQILWINLVTDSIQDIALAFEPAHGDELAHPPRPRREGVLSRALWVRTFLTGVWMGMIVLVVFEGALRSGADLEYARSLALVTFVFFNVFQVGNARSEKMSLFRLNPLRNRLLLVSVVVSVALLWAVMAWPAAAGVLGVVPLAPTDWAVAALIASSVLVVVETGKLVHRRLERRAAQRAPGSSSHPADTARTQRESHGESDRTRPADPR